MKKTLFLGLGALTSAAAWLLSPAPAAADGRGGGGQPPAPCVATYAAIDLASRSMSWGVYCPEGGNVYVDAQLFYGSDLETLPDAGARTLIPGETWTVWTQDTTRTGSADHGVLHIVQEFGSGPASVLAHVVK